MRKLASGWKVTLCSEMHVNQCCFKEEHNDAFKFMPDSIWDAERNQGSRAEAVLAHFCDRHHHNQLLGEANFPHQCAACHLFPGHLWHSRNWNHKSSTGISVYVIPVWHQQMGMFSSSWPFYVAMMGYVVIFTPNPIVLIFRNCSFPCGHSLPPSGP